MNNVMNDEVKKENTHILGDKFSVKVDDYILSIQAQKVEKHEFSIANYWKEIKKYKLTILFYFIACTLLAVAISFIISPVYRAEIVMVPVDDDEKKGGLSSLAGQFGGLASMAGVDLRSEGNKDSSIAALKSRIFIMKFIQNKNLLPILFDGVWDKKNKRWIISDEEGVPTLLDGYKFFIKNVMKVSDSKKTGLLTMFIEWKDPVQSALWANELIEKINEHLRSDAVNKSNENINYLKEQLKQTTIVGIEKSIFGLIENEMKKSMLANVNDEYAFRVIDPAITPENKIKPKRLLIILFGGILGLFLGILVSIIKNNINNSRLGNLN